jgi:hypothetical protein
MTERSESSHQVQYRTTMTQKVSKYVVKQNRSYTGIDGER